MSAKNFLYKALTAVERITHSKYLFYILNKRNIESGKNNGILKSIAVLKCTTPEQLIYFTEKMKDNDAVIFMFHSIIDKTVFTIPRTNGAGTLHVLKSCARI